MTVTAIRQINNNSSQTIEVHDHYNPPISKTLSPTSSVGVDIWIPWCTSSTDFWWLHYLTIEEPQQQPVKVLYTIWQNGDQVSYSTDGHFHDPGVCVPGVCATGGDRILTINTDLSMTFSKP